ncbi:MAG TPA: peptide ABC transporter substrate-binding protein [Pseudomonadales bacterium]|jgi:oligopeptide transport system substrate-binding protein|nr:peptide ABC transporter substrate-binding protein [Pseudomonadales bacterium]
MSDVITDSGDSFTRSAGRQLALLALFGILAFIALAILLGWLSKLTSGGGSLSEAVDPLTGTITLAMASEPPQLDSTRATDQVSGFVLGHVMESLLRRGPGTKLLPGVAERWEIDEKGATFWLRPDARWSDGKPVTAHDFVFAWRKIVEPANASEYAFFLYPIKNGEAINRGELPVESLGARAVDDRTLAVDFERPTPYFEKLVVYATYGPVREDFYESCNGRYGADADAILYNGPFRISKWVHGAHLRFEKNPYYWDPDRIKLDVIDMPYVTNDANAVLNLYKDGKIATAPLSAETLNDALEHRWKINRFNDGSVFYTEFNHRPGRLTANVNLRRALALVSDPGELVYKVMKVPGNLPGVSLFPAWLPGVNGLFRQEYPPATVHVDVAEARRYLELAKQELGVETMPPLILLTGDDPLSNSQAEYFQNVFKRTLDIDVKIDKQIFKQRLAKMTAGQFDMVAAGWGPDYDDPLTFGDLFSSWNKNNRGAYSNPELDRYVRIAQSSLDPKARMDAFGAIQKIVQEDVVIIPSYERGLVYVRNPRLNGIVRRVVGADPDYTSAYIGGSR